MMKLTNLLEEFQGTQGEYLDIVNYEIARIYAVISSYYPEYQKKPNLPNKCR